MKRYLIAYGIWFVSVLAVGSLVSWWYKHVEGIDLYELVKRAKETKNAQGSE